MRQIYVNPLLFLNIPYYFNCKFCTGSCSKQPLMVHNFYRREPAPPPPKKKSTPSRKPKSYQTPALGKAYIRYSVNRLAIKLKRRMNPCSSPHQNPGRLAGINSTDWVAHPATNSEAVRKRNLDIHISLVFIVLFDLMFLLRI